MESPKRHFILIHGACHGAWCWYKVAPLPRSSGHEVTTLDMASCRVQPKRVTEVESFVEYSEPLLQAMESIPDDETVILVGHSFGSHCLALAMQRYPEKISAAVFMTASLPHVGSPMSIFTEEDVTEEKYGSVSRVYIVCGADNSWTPEFQRLLVEKCPGTEMIEMDCADHMPMLSMPTQLFHHLVDIATKYT